MTRLPFTLKWNTHGNEAEHLVFMAKEHLDRRNKYLKDEGTNHNIVTNILAHKAGEFHVILGDIPKDAREPLKAALEGLTGPVLTRGSGRATYALREAYTASTARFTTDAIDLSSGRPAPPVETRFGTIYKDGSHSEVPFKDIKLFGYSRPSLVQIVAPHHHWKIFLSDAPPPSANWENITEVDEHHECHDELMNLIVDHGKLRGVVITRYGGDSFLTINPDSVLFTIDTTLVRYSGKSGQRPLLKVTDIYQRTHTRWGSKAKS